jgi:hypothetical protein
MIGPMLGRWDNWHEPQVAKPPHYSYRQTAQLCGAKARRPLCKVAVELTVRYWG